MTMNQLLKHRYQILKVLSESGGFAQTFLGEVTDMPSRRSCVIKKLRPIADPEDFKYAQERFRREATILERLGDANDQIPKLYAYFVEDQEFYLVQEFVEGLTLREIAQHGVPLGERIVGELLIALLDVLAYVHEQNVIHRDIKPDNVILRRRDNKPVLIDFGIVKEVLRASGDGSLTHSLVAGTPGYISPEQAAGRPVFASDLYSLGITAIFLLTGQNPRRITDSATGKINWRPHAPGVSAAFAAILDKATEIDLRARYQSARQMSKDLQQVFFFRECVLAPPQLTTALEEETVVRPAAAPPPNSEPRRQHYALCLSIAAAVFGLLAVIGSVVALARLDIRNREENTWIKGESFSENPGQPSRNKVSTSKATRPPASGQSAKTIPITPTPAESSRTPIVRADVPGRFPEASTRLLTRRDLVNRSQWELRVMRNEIFARHGYIFKSAEMYSYFNRQQWYSPRYDDISGRLSDIEARNVKLLRSSNRLPQGNDLDLHAITNTTWQREKVARADSSGLRRISPHWTIFATFS